MEDVVMTIDLPDPLLGIRPEPDPKPNPEYIPKR